MWVVVRTDRVLQRAGRNKTALCNVTLTDDKLPCISRYRIRVSIKVAVDRVHLYALIDITRYGTVIIALLCQVFVIVESRLVTQHKGTFHVLLNGILVGCDGKEQFMETAHVFSAAMAAGERSLRRAAAALPVLEVSVRAGACFFNVNTPAALRLARGRAANLVRRVPIVSIVAPASGTGKTTFVEKLLPLLTSRGVRVGVVKSDAHGIVLNDGTKDSGCFRAAGASSVAVVAPAGFWLYERTQEKLSLEAAAARMTGVDLVLIETRSHGVFPVLSLWRGLEEPLLDERVAALFSSCRERQAEGILQLDLEAMEDAAHLVLFLMGREEGFDLHRTAWDGGHSGKGGA